MKFLRNRITVYVPTGVYAEVRQYLDELADAAGGSTTVQAEGQWRQQREPVSLVTVFYELDARPRVQNALDNLLMAMARAGEVEVLVDHTPAQAVLV